MTMWEDWATSSDDRTPIYLQIIDRFKRGIVKGELQSNARLPSIRDLAVQLRVNPNTAQRAYQEMERTGLIYAQRGMGYYVTEDEETIMQTKTDLAKASIERFLLEMQSLGLTEEQIIETIHTAMQREGEPGDE